MSSGIGHHLPQMGILDFTRFEENTTKKAVADCKNFFYHVANICENDIDGTLNFFWNNSEYNELAQILFTLGFYNPTKFDQEVQLFADMEDVSKKLQVECDEVALLFEDLYPSEVLSKEDFLAFLLAQAQARIFPLVRNIICSINPNPIHERNKVDLKDFKEVILKDDLPFNETNKVDFKEIILIENLPFTGHFYKIKDFKFKTVGYLFGTMHNCDSSVFKLNRQINKAIVKSKKIFLELNNHEEIHREQKLSIFRMLEEEDTSVLVAAVSRYEHQFSQRENNFSWAEIKLNHCFDMLTPFQQLKLCCEHYDFTMSQELGKTGDEVGIIGIDDLLFKKCKLLDKPVFGLETIDDLPPNLVEKGLHNVKVSLLYPNIDEVKEGIREWSARWLSGEGVQLPIAEEGTEWWYQTCGRSQKFARVILDDLQKDNGRAFYAFGLGHLYDDSNVIKCLKEHQYKIVRC